MKFGKYEVGDKIGSGAYADVWAADEYVVKAFISEDDAKSFKDEVAILRKLGRGDGFVHLEDTFAYFDPDKNFIHYCIVMPRMGCDLGELLDELIDRDQEIAPQYTKLYTRQLMAALSYIHERDVVHCDIKPTNILLDCSVEQAIRLPQHVNLKLCDFGHSIVVNPHGFRMDRIGTTGYLAPELIWGLRCGPPVDIWSAFCTCFEMYTTAPLFDVHNDYELNYGVKVPSFEGEVSEKLAAAKKEAVYLLLIEALLGPTPSELALGKHYENGRLIEAPVNCSTFPMGLHEHMIENYECDNLDDVHNFVEFILSGLTFSPTTRPTAAAVLSHPWLA